jgi:hypothetical protein
MGYPYRSAQIRGRFSWQQKTNAARASHPSRIVRGFLCCLCHRMAADDRFSPTAASLFRARRAAFTEASCRFAVLRPRTRNHCDRQRPCSCSVPSTARASGGGGRNARATSRACARFLECPPAIHPRESPAAAGSAAIIRQAQERSRFAEPTLSQFVAPRNTKNFSPCAETVEHETSLWKP